MGRKDSSARTGSTASTQSTDTLLASQNAFRTPSQGKTPGQLNADGRNKFDSESQISPTAAVGRTNTSNTVSINDSPLDYRMNDFDGWNPHPTTIASSAQVAPWLPSNGPLAMPSSTFSASFFDDAFDDLSPGSQLSPSFRPGTGRTATTLASDSPAEYFDDQRRPSIASITTASSTGSKSSTARGGLHKKLHGFFGEDYTTGDVAEGTPVNMNGKEQRSNSNAKNNRDRKPSTSGGTPAREPSPSTSRPRTPVQSNDVVPSSDVVPFLYQDSQDIFTGDAPVRQDLSGPDRERYVADEGRQVPPKTSSSISKIHLPGHMRNKSVDDPKSQRPSISRTASRDEPILAAQRGRAPSTMTNFTKGSGTARDKSPTPSDFSQTSMTAGAKDTGAAGKRSLLSRFRKNKDKEEPKSPLKRVPTSEPTFPISDPKPLPSPEIQKKWSREGSIANSEMSYSLTKTDTNQFSRQLTRQGTFQKLNLTRKKGTKSQDDYEQGLVPGERKPSIQTPSMFDLDQDFTNMEGILSQPPPVAPLEGGGILAGKIEDEVKAKAETESAPGMPSWDAPDSWGVKRVDEMATLTEVDDGALPPDDEENALPYCVRVFRSDGTFATLSMSLGSTVKEVMIQLSKKTLINEPLENYQIVMKKHDLQRILGPGERPLAIQKRLLEQAGYEWRDRLEDVGREDNSYLCRFMFVPTRESGYAAISQDPGFEKNQKFSHINLSGRNLITMPIALYSKAAEIISLNLSRNLSLDIPKDFIQLCINLRDIKYINNEAWRLPPSLSRASRLTILDVSNNRLEHGQLEIAELERLHGLISLKLANNRLTHLPPFFGGYKSMRTLNVSSNFLGSFPKFLCDLPALVDLDLSFNAIGELPDEISKLQSLERFVITNNKLSGSLPGSFSQLTKLKEVDIRYNALSSLDVVAALPNVEQISADHNSISVFEGKFEKIRILRLNSNPVTKFEILNDVPTLTTLILSNAKLAHIPDACFDRMPNLVKLVIDKNHFVSLPSHIGSLKALEHFSLARNGLSILPPEIGNLTELRFLDVSQNNLKKLPAEIWWAGKLESLNISSNVLANFPKPASRPQQATADGVVSDRSLTSTPAQTPSLSKSPSFEELGPLEAFGQRRSSQVSGGGLMSVGNSPVPAGADRKNSVVSVYGKGGRKTSVVSRTASQGTMDTATTLLTSRKESSLSAKLSNTIAGSLKNLYLADNQLDDECFDELILLGELRVLNLSYNEITDMPQRSIKSWPQLVELYLSGNELTCLPSDDFEDSSLLQILHINGNKFQTLPAELSKAHRLAVLECGSNSLKYNVSNWPYDWNWNYNPNLKYLNFSGNKRLEIKPNVGGKGGLNREERNLTDFSELHNLRILGLMDVTLTIPVVPDETEDRRVRTTDSLAGSLAYGMADSLGRNEHLSIQDLLIPRFNSNDSETLFGMFDGQSSYVGGSKIAKYLHENFGSTFGTELNRVNPAVQETPADALRRTFLSLNKDLATAATVHMAGGGLLSHRGSAAPAVLTQADLQSGGVATVMFMSRMDLYVANVGDAQGMLIQSDGSHRVLTRKHDPAEPSERQRIRDAGGWVSRQGKLNDTLEVSRAFGYVQLMPVVQASPHISQVQLKEQDEMLLIASSELWEYLSPELVVDVARSERNDLVRAAQRLRDLAMAFGATNKIMVMIIGIGDLKKRDRNRLTRGTSMSMGPSGVLDEVYMPSKRGKRGKESVEDSMLRRLEAEVQAPVGDISIVFTDIKSSTLIWENYPQAMRSCIKLHNEVMRRQLRIIGGYEVKTEGDAFMVSFPTATSALLWCFSVQQQLLEVQWPAEILNHAVGQEVLDRDGNLIFRGISVRMGIHFGAPVCENDPVTRRMDYFGPMVNKTARISSTADGGQITVSSDFISEIQRCLETFSETDRSGSTGSEDTFDNDVYSQTIRRELRSLSSQGFEVKPMGERKLKGLENPEHIYLMYPHALAGRLVHQPLLGCDLSKAEEKKTKDDKKAGLSADDKPMSRDANSQLNIDPESAWELWRISLRLEMLCHSLEIGDAKDEKDFVLAKPHNALLESMTNRTGEVPDEFLIGFLTHMVSRTEAFITTLAIRKLVLQKDAEPRAAITDIKALSSPTEEVLNKVIEQHDELRRYKEKFGDL